MMQSYIETWLISCLHPLQLLLEFQDYGLQLPFFFQAAALQLLQSGLQLLVLCLSILQLGLAQTHQLLQVTLEM